MYTKHSKEQMAKRNISHNQIIKALTNGTVLINKHDSNKRTIIDNAQGLYVITNDTKTIIITTFWKG